MPNPLSRLLLMVALCGTLPSLADAKENAPLQGPSLTEILELRGVTKINGIFEFSIYNKEKKRSEWLRPRERLEGYEILEYDFQELFVVVRYNDRVGRIPLHHAQIAHYTESASPPGAPPVAPVPALPPVPSTFPPSTMENENRGFLNARQRAGNNRPSTQGSSLRESNSRSGGFLPGATPRNEEPPSNPTPPNQPPPPSPSPSIPSPNPPSGGGEPVSPPSSSIEPLGPPPPMPRVPMPGYSPKT